jgi:hypothetical protein
MLLLVAATLGAVLIRGSDVRHALLAFVANTFGVDAMLYAVSGVLPAYWFEIAWIESGSVPSTPARFGLIAAIIALVALGIQGRKRHAVWVPSVILAGLVVPLLSFAFPARCGCWGVTRSRSRDWAS